jgi:hypothetical protein
MKFTVGMGYYDSGKTPVYYRAQLLNSCLLTTSEQSLRPAKTIIIGCGESYFNSGDGRVQFVELAGNLGHVENLLGVREPKKDYKFGGWSITVLTLALLAYQNETDFIFVEQDVLLFGNVFQKMYEEIGEAPVIHGGSTSVQPAANSLFLVRHAYIPQFVRLYLNAGQDADPDNLPEMKFDRLGKKYGWTTFSFGYDRDRPENLEDLKHGPCYIQQVTSDEWNELNKRGWI